MDSKRLLAALALVLLGAAVSGVLLLQHHGEPTAVSAVAQACGEGAESGCDRVNLSPWAKIGALPVAAIGLAFYLSVAGLLALATRAKEDADAAARTVIVLLVLALAVDLGLLAIQAFSIGAYCKLCLLTYALNAAALFALWPARRAGVLSATPSGRVVAFGWGLATLASFLFVVAWNAALIARAQQRAASILGAPAAASAPAAPASAGELRAEVERLKGILEDPRKHEEYLQQKSVADFDSATAQDIAMAGVPFKGPADARLKVVEYSDFLCPFCRAIAGAFRDFIPQAKGRVSVHFKHYPLDQACNPGLSHSIHPGACLLAKGAICAHAQGRFWDFHDRVFQAPPQNPGRDTVVGLAAAAGLDSPRLGACLDAPETDARLKAEIAEAQRLGVNSTPTVFINGKKLPRVNDFLLVLDKESARLGLPALPPPAKP